MSKTQLYLGIDGGQSHTEALVADANGNILGRGLGGASNHAEQPGGRERLQNAVMKSVGAALQNAGLGLISDTDFVSAHCAMTGGADYKEDIIGNLIQSENLVIAHDAPAALFGATAGKPGIVVIAGTGSVIYGENEHGETARAGGLGYLFSDEGSGFWLALQMIKIAIQEQDGLIVSQGITEKVLEFFQRKDIRDVTTDFYNGKLSRDELASFAKAVHEFATSGNETARNQILHGAISLAERVATVAGRLNFAEKFPVAGVGGVFRGELMQKYFGEELQKKVRLAEFIKPRFNPAIGALLLAYREAGIEITEKILKNLSKQIG